MVEHTSDSTGSRVLRISTKLGDSLLITIHKVRGINKVFRCFKTRVRVHDKDNVNSIGDLICKSGESLEYNKYFKYKVTRVRIP